MSQTDGTQNITWQSSYEAFGSRTQEQGTTSDRQKANTKDEDPTGLLNEGMRYRDLEFGVFISRDPAGFIDGPNVYTYVRQNPWTYYDPYGLWGLGESNGPVLDCIWNFGGGAAKSVGDAAFTAKDGVTFVVGGTINAVGAAFGHEGSKEMGAERLDTLVKTGQGLKQAVSNPLSTGKAIANEYKEKLKTSGGTGEVIGELGLSIFTGGFLKLLDKSTDVSRLGNSARNLADKAKGSVDFTADLTKSKAKSGSGHRNAGNKQLHEEMAADPDYRKHMEAKYGNDVFDRTSTSNGGRRNPQDSEWHHPDDPTKLELMHKSDHRSPSSQSTLHPEGRGGYSRNKNEQEWTDR